MAVYRVAVVSVAWTLPFHPLPWPPKHLSQSISLSLSISVSISATWHESTPRFRFFLIIFEWFLKLLLVNVLIYTISEIVVQSILIWRMVRLFTWLDEVLSVLYSSTQVSCCLIFLGKEYFCSCDHKMTQVKNDDWWLRKERCCI